MLVVRYVASVLVYAAVCGLIVREVAPHGPYVLWPVFIAQLAGFVWLSAYVLQGKDHANALMRILGMFWLIMAVVAAATIGGQWLLE